LSGVTNLSLGDNMSGINIKGEVSIDNGNNKIEAENSITKSGIRQLVTLLGFVAHNVNPAHGNLYDSSARIKLGDDTSTKTALSTESLQGALISGSADSRTVTSSESGGTYKAKLINTWDSGTLTEDTLGEVVLETYGLKASGNIPYDAYDYHSQSQNFFGRASSADGDFSSFTIDTTEPLTVVYKIIFEV